MGEAPEVGAPKARKPQVSRWATRRVVHGPPRRGARSAETPAQVFSSRVEDPLKSWGWRSRPQSPQGSRLSKESVVSPLLAESGRMAQWHISQFCGRKLKSAVAVHRSMKHSFRAQDTPNADAELAHHNEHFGAHGVAEGMAAFRARLPESFRKDAVQAIEYLMTASPESDGQQEPGRAGCVFPGRWTG